MATNQAYVISEKQMQAREIGQTNAATFVSIKHSTIPREGLRANALAILHKQLSEKPTLLGLYVAYEPNAFDGLDAEYTTDEKSSDSSGRFIPYVYRDGSSIDITPLVGYEDPTKDDNGIRIGEYYLCSKDGKTDCIIDPYLYPIGDVQVLLTSIVSPQIDQGRFMSLPQF